MKLLKRVILFFTLPLGIIFMHVHKSAITSWLSLKNGVSWEVSINEIYKTEQLITTTRIDKPLCREVLSNIPEAVYEYVKELVQTSKVSFPQCHMSEKGRTNLVFVKTHKCASDSLSLIFRRFALNVNLSVALPLGKKFLLGWPHTLRPYMYRPTKTGVYNMFLDHMVFNHQYMQSVVPSDSVYISTVREPFSRLKSAIRYFGYFKRAYFAERSDAVQSFLDDMETADARYKTNDNIFMYNSACVPPGVSITQNSMAFDLGFPTGYHLNTTDQTTNYTFIKQWLKDINSQIDMFVVTEYFDESMVMMKRSLCWSWKDILYTRVNYQKYTPSTKYNISQIDRYNNWSNVDTLLYLMVNSTFWKRVEQFGEDFYDEVQAFKVHLTQVDQFCQQTSLQTMEVDENKWNSGYYLHQTDCEQIKDPDHLRQKLRDVYDSINVKVPDTLKPNWHGLRWC